MGCRLFPGWAGGMLAHCGKEKKQNTEKSTNRTYSVLDSVIVLPLSYLFIYLFIYTMSFFISGCCRSPVLVGRDQEHEHEDPTYTNRTTSRGLGKTRRGIKQPLFSYCYSLGFVFYCCHLLFAIGTMSHMRTHRLSKVSRSWAIFVFLFTALNVVVLYYTRHVSFVERRGNVVDASRDEIFVEE